MCPQTGLGWFGGSRKRNLRYECNAEDELQQWGWTHHDGVGFGEQLLKDPANGVVRVIC